MWIRLPDRSATARANRASASPWIDVAGYSLASVRRAACALAMAGASSSARQATDSRRVMAGGSGRAGEAERDAAGVARRDEHGVLTGVANAPRGRRHAVLAHPPIGGVHAARPEEHLERPRPAARESVGGRPGPRRLGHRQSRRAKVEDDH